MVGPGEDHQDPAVPPAAPAVRVVNLRNFDNDIAMAVLRNRQWRDLTDRGEWNRLQQAIKRDKGGQPIRV